MQPRQKTCLLSVTILTLCATCLPACTSGDDSPRTTITASALGSTALPSSGFGDTGITQSTPPSGWPTGSVSWCCGGGSWWTPIAASASDVVGSISVQVQDVAPSPTCIPGSCADGGSVVRLDLVSQVGTTTTLLATGWTMETGSPVTGTGTVQTVTLNLSSHTVVVGESLFLKATAEAFYPSTVMHPSMIGPVAVTAARSLHTRKLSVFGGTNIGGGTFQTLAGQLTGNWSPVADGDMLAVQLPVEAGDRFESIAASIYGSTAYTVTMSARAQDDALHVGARLGSEQVSAAQVSTQTLTVVPIANDNSGNNELVTTSQRSYSLLFVVHQVSQPDGSSLYVGPITLVTSAN